MNQRMVTRYSMGFKQQVVEQLESGRFSSISQAKEYYGITGAQTIKRWLGKYGRNHLCAKVVRVERPNERNQILELKKQIKQLKEALGQTQAQNVLNQEFLKIACEEMGQDLDSFKKKSRCRSVHGAGGWSDVSVRRLCQEVKMTRQNYYKQRCQRQRRQVDEAFILALVRRERAVQPRLGARKLLHILRPEFELAGVSIGRDRFFSLLAREDLLIKRRAKGCRTTDSRHWFRVYGNLLKDVSLSGPSQAVVSDITYIRTDEGFMYLSLVMDAYSRAILGYDCSDNLEAEGALRSLSMALRRLGRCSGAIHHSDRGSQYCSTAYVAKLKRRGLRISMTEVNHCYENSQAERLNGILKEEYGIGCRFLSKPDALIAVREAVSLYNYRRPHQALGYRCPMEVHLAA